MKPARQLGRASKRELQCERRGLFRAARLARLLIDEIEEAYKSQQELRQRGIDSTVFLSLQTKVDRVWMLGFYRDCIRQHAASLIAAAKGKKASR